MECPIRAWRMSYLDWLYDLLRHCMISYVLIRSPLSTSHRLQPLSQPLSRPSSRGLVSEVLVKGLDRVSWRLDRN